MKNKLISLFFAFWMSAMAVFNAAAKQIFPGYDDVYILSPHPDDGILTFGGMLGNIDNRFDTRKIHYTVLANLSQYVVNGDENSLAGVTGLRHLEDINAYDFLLTSPDGIRHYTYSALNEKDAPLINMRDADFSSFNAQAIVDFNNAYSQIANLMEQASLEGKTCAFFVNAALPNPQGLPHFNHFLLREATLKAVHDLGTKKLACEVYIGEDLPYYNNNEAGSKDIINQLTARLKLSIFDYPIDVDKKMEAVNYYPSQLTSDYEESVRKRAHQLNGKERVYKIDATFYDDIHTDPSCGNQDFCTY
ncbi:hypothetical protein QNH14_12435 [Apirhabdus apintestini]|uniref:hypothetical protein n=1 Tax=Erwinia sp. HR93 TaxID=3094840 RepID=UPI002ADED3B9|nr:hypothetical protein [Erwinia sp. HR93]MEA1064361.1 hypothetical protein [Erwinia sp. HR93]WPM83935.1 hypothetical protein QNH14_12435 [Enterobacteriaceae bacterium CA-0114]